MCHGFRAPIDDVWTSVRDPENTARWIGRWNDDGAPGRTVRLQMRFEKGQPLPSFGEYFPARQEYHKGGEKRAVGAAARTTDSGLPGYQ